VDTPDADTEDPEEPESNFIADLVKNGCASLLDPFLLEVTVYALVCSSDNIAIYIALFAAMTVWETVGIIAIFYVLLGVNCAIAIALMQCSAVAQAFEEYSKFFVPFFLMFLGVYILSESILWPF
jgi:cadmium resistance protein CadD (predicted permease)